MAELTVRDRIIRALEDLPPDVTFEEAIERLVFLAKIDAGIAELDDGKGISHGLHLNLYPLRGSFVEIATVFRSVSFRNRFDGRPNIRLQPTAAGAIMSHRG